MTTNNTDIVLSFDGTTKIEFIKTRTNVKEILTVNTKRVQLSLSTQYIFPISNKTMSMTDSNTIKKIGKVNRKLNIIDVQDGMVIIEPRIHGVFIEHEEVLGSLI
jgi:hypothetical protein